MKKIALGVVFLLFLQKVFSQVITELEIYYLPWSIRPETTLNAGDVRNFNNGLNSYLCIQDSVAIQEFVKSMSIFYMRPFPELNKMNHVMVIDIRFDDNTTQTLGLNTYQHFWYLGLFYHKNFELIKWINKFVPPAKIPRRF